MRPCWALSFTSFHQPAGQGYGDRRGRDDHEDIDGFRGGAGDQVGDVACGILGPGGDDDHSRLSFHECGSQGVAGRRRAAPTVTETTG